MSRYYEDRMESDLQEIHDRVRKVSDMVEDQLLQAVQALFEYDQAAAAEVVLGDRQVNRRIKEIDRLCHAFIVRHAPSEQYLRRASAVLRLDVALERVGDYASSIGREVGRLSAAPPRSVAHLVRTVADHARISLADALRAFHSGDVDDAASSDPIPEDEVEATFDGILQAGNDGERSLVDIFGLTHVVNLLMRVAEQSNNIREQTLFAISGVIPERKAFRVLFVDERNDRSSLIAEAYARSTFPGSGTYLSAGWSPAEGPRPEVADLLAAKGLELPSGAPRPLSDAKEEPLPHHVVVLMHPEGRAQVEPIPFRTTLVTWNLDEEGSASLDEIYGDVEMRVDELMWTLAGPEAA